ncbi:MAG: hypothetical protein H0T62_03595 [Parachlamydiaceae bacterium]|nr:hypothetical protein [Parachlamydiaceae bacterium]
MIVTRPYFTVFSAYRTIHLYKFPCKKSEIRNDLFSDKIADITPFPDQHLAKMFKQRYQHTEDNITLGIVLLHPKTITNYWRVAKSMQKKGLIPFAHGQAMVWAIPQRILKALGYSGCQLLRFSNSPSLKTPHEIIQIVESEMIKNKTNPMLSRFFPFFGKGKALDHRSELRNHMLSVTLGLFHLEIKESPFSFAVGGVYKSHSGLNTYEYEGNRNVLPLKKCIVIANHMISQALEERGVASETRYEVIKKIKDLYEEAAQLSIGQIIVCGVPLGSLSTTVYHCEPLGFPTRLSIHKIMEDLSLEKFNPKCYQARLLFCQEMMRENSPVEVVNIMDECAVHNFSEGLGHLLIDEEEGLKEIINYVHTEKEDEHIRANNHFYEKIDRVIEIFNLCHHRD